MPEQEQNPLENIDLKKIFLLLLSKKQYILIFVTFITFFTLVFALSLPNVYQSTVILETENSGKQGSSGGLSTLAGLAGVSMDGKSDNIVEKMNLIISDYNFNYKVVSKYKLNQRLNEEELSKDYVFASNIRIVYDLVHFKMPGDSADAYASVDSVAKFLPKIIQLSKSKDGFIFLGVTHSNRKFAKNLVDIYLEEVSTELKKRDLSTLEDKIYFYQHELSDAEDIELKLQLSSEVSDLLRKKILLNVNKYYLFNIIVEAREAFGEEKIGPKRLKMIVIAFVFSIVFSVALIIAIDVFKKEEE